jgi:hypothetical protein
LVGAPDGLGEVGLAPSEGGTKFFYRAFHFSLD